jgi:hypothetical protein
MNIPVEIGKLVRNEGAREAARKMDIPLSSLAAFLQGWGTNESNRLVVERAEAYFGEQKEAS